MEFLNPAALFGLFALPLLLIPYLVRRKPRRLVFSSVLLFIEGRAQASGRPFGRIHVPPIFFLQLLLLALLIFALSEPVFSVRPTQVAILLDNSASMQTLEDGRTRLSLAQEKIGDVIGELGVGGQVDLYLTTPALAKVQAEPLTPGQALSAVENIRAYDLGDPPIDYDRVLQQLARERGYERVYLFTDHPGSGQSTAARVISVGRPQGNLAVTAFDVHRASLNNARLEANAVVANFSGKDEKIKIALKGDGSTLASRELVVPAARTATATFEGFAEHPSYQVEIEKRDALALDNRRFAVAPTSRNLRILAVTPRPQSAASLKSIQGVTVDIISPAEYAKFDGRDYGLEIFHFSAPAQLPRNPALFILPPENSSLVNLGAPFSNVQVSSWREPHVLTRYVNFSLFRPTYARPLKPQSAGQVVVESPAGALAFAVERPGARYLTLGFDPLPYLGRANLPMSIFTLNVLDWFFQSGGSRSQATGEPIPLTGMQSGETLVTPTDEKIALKSASGSFAATFHQGIYRRVRGGARELYARNLDDLGESDLRTPTPIELRGETAHSGSASVLFSFWPYLLLASLLLLLIEWFINPRRARATVPGVRRVSRQPV
ncbi:MAG TPA: VWA domain-containing protein [Candidatus Binatia bacterium]|jgi:multidrug efflux pump subunit AcrA (membrane-fusion protein)